MLTLRSVQVGIGWYVESCNISIMMTDISKIVLHDSLLCNVPSGQIRSLDFTWEIVLPKIRTPRKSRLIEWRVSFVLTLRYKVIDPALSLSSLVHLCTYNPFPSLDFILLLCFLSKMVSAHLHLFLKHFLCKFLVGTPLVFILENLLSEEAIDLLYFILPLFNPDHSAHGLFLLPITCLSLVLYDLVFHSRLALLWF